MRPNHHVRQRAPRRIGRHLLILLPVLPALAGCSATLGPEANDDGDAGSIDHLPRPLTVVEQALITESNSFGLDLTRRVLAVDERSNVVLSPLSASMALGMVLNGASGSTLDGMRSALGFGDLSRMEINEAYRGLLELLGGLDPAVDLSVANSAWANREYTFHQPFFDAVTTHFDAEVQSLDFSDPATLAAINGWVDDRTEGRIDGILEDLDPELALLLLNAIWFDGKWTTSFDPDDTRDGQFTREDGSTVSARMMNMPEAEIPFGGTDDWVAVELPYGGGAWTMVVMVPRGSRTARELLAGMDGAEWEALLGSLQEQELDALSIPRFTLTYDVLLNDPLSAMGMEEAFTPRADFSDLSPTPLCIDFVRQKTFIEVDEAGTKAAAVTAVGVGPTSFTGLIADRPFVFAIRERLSGTLLFMGLVGDPTQEDSGPANEAGRCAER